MPQIKAVVGQGMDNDGNKANIGPPEFPMKATSFISAVLVFLLGSALPLAAEAFQHAHEHVHATDETKAAFPAQPWSSDAALRDGMTRIHEALEQLRHYEMGHMDATLARDRVEVIREAVADIFAHCELAPEPDAALHGMLVPLLAAAQAFDSDPADMQQIEAMRAALGDYPHYFDAPRWPVDEVHGH